MLPVQKLLGYALSIRQQVVEMHNRKHGLKARQKLGYILLLASKVSSSGCFVVFFKKSANHLPDIFMMRFCVL